MDRRVTPFRVLFFAWSICAFAAIGSAGADSGPAANTPVRATRVAIITGTKGTEPELKAAEILKSRMLKRSAISVEMLREDDANPGDRIDSADVVIVIGSPNGNGLGAKLMKEFGMSLPVLPDTNTPHPEGFAVKSGVLKKRYIVVAGSDERGTLYGIGWLLRAMTYLPDAVLIPDVDVQDKPAFPLRGGRPAGPGSRARQFGNLRPQTAEEQNEVMEDIMLLGTNIFAGDP